MKKIIRSLPLCLMIVATLLGCQKERFISEEGNLVPKTVEQDASLPAISVNGSKFHAEAFGSPDSPMLVILHGGPGSDYRYLLNCRQFADEGYFVVFYDQRGSGLSQRHSKNIYSIQIMLDDLQSVISHYRHSSNQKVFLLGHSWGAILATAYVNENPGAINGAILAEPGGFLWQDIMDYVNRARTVRMTSELVNDILYQDQFITGKKDQHAILDYKYGLLAIADGNKDNPTGNEGLLPFWRGGAIVNQALFDIGEREKPDWTQNLGEFQRKVLFVYSEKNRAYGINHAQKVSSAYPDVELFEVMGAGHDMISFPAGWSQFFPKALSYLNEHR